MASSLETTIKNAIAAHDSLTAIMHACQTDNGITNAAKPEWLSCLQDVYVAYIASYATPSAEAFAAAIYTVWGVGQPTATKVAGRLSSVDLTDALEYIKDAGNNQVYASATVPATVAKFFAEISVVIDSASILAHENNNSGGMINIGQYVHLTDNEPTSTGEGGNELVTKGLRASQTIHWAASNQSGNAIINLTQFVAGANSLYQMIYVPVKINNLEYYTQVLPVPILEQSSYRFYFTLNGGTTTFWWDPWLNDMG